MYLFIDKKNKDNPSLYVHKKFRDESGKSTTKVVENLGKYNDLLKLHDDPVTWAKQYINSLNDAEKEASRSVMVSYSPVKQISTDEKNTMDGGYLFLHLR